MSAGVGPAVLASVIVPVRNGAGCIADLLESLVADHSTTPFELVIADNGSTDATAEVVAGFADRIPNLRVIDASARPGAGFARRAGAEAARTDLLLFVDADDTVDPGYVDAMVRALGAAPYVHACSDTDLLNPPWLHKINPGLGCTTIATGTWKWALGSTVGIRRDVYDAAGGWSPTIRFSEDADLGLRVRHRTGVEPVAADGANVHVRLRLEWQASFRQGIVYGTGQSTVNRAWRRHGVDPDSDRSVVGRIPPLLRRIPALRSPVERYDWCQQTGVVIGRLSTTVKDGIAERIGLRRPLPVLDVPVPSTDPELDRYRALRPVA